MTCRFEAAFADLPFASDEEFIDAEFRWVSWDKLSGCGSSIPLATPSV
jgi:hypothetical protein